MNRLGMLLALASAFAYAETWAGKLIDADCLPRNAMAACTPTSSTSSFAVEVSGKKYTFDQAGNRKAAETLKASESGAERAKNPDAKSSGITASVNGTLRGDEIQVASITVH